MENGPEPTPCGPKWPNKAWKRILTPIRIHPCASQHQVAHMATPQAFFTQILAPFSAKSGQAGQARPGRPGQARPAGQGQAGTFGSLAGPARNFWTPPVFGSPNRSSVHRKKRGSLICLLCMLEVSLFRSCLLCLRFISLPCRLSFMSVILLVACL